METGDFRTGGDSLGTSFAGGEPAATTYHPGRRTNRTCAERYSHLPPRATD